MRLSIIQGHSFGENLSKLQLEMPENCILNRNSALMVIPLLLGGAGGSVVVVGGGLIRGPERDILKVLGRCS